MTKRTGLMITLSIIGIFAIKASIPWDWVKGVFIIVGSPGFLFLFDLLLPDVKKDTHEQGK